MADVINKNHEDALDEAVLCESEADYDGLASRALIGQILRPYLDAHCLIPSELLHGSQQLRQLLDQRQMVEAALDRVAALQGLISGQEPRTRRAALHAALQAVVRRVKSADAVLAGVPRHLTAVAAYSNGTIEHAARFGPGLALAALVRDLAGITGWVAKFDHLLGLVRQQSASPLRDAIDSVLGDALMSEAALRELIGQRVTLGATLCRLLETIEGRVPMDANRADRLGTISHLCRQDRLPMVRAAVIERIRRQLKGTESLSPGQSDRETGQFRTLLLGLLTAEGVIGGQPMAVALTLRYARRFKEGGANGLRRAVTTISDSLPDLTARVHYLAVVASPGMVIQIGDEVITSLDAALGSDALVEVLVFGSADCVATYHSLIRASAVIVNCALHESVRGQLAGQVRRVVDEYAVSGRLLSRLDALVPGTARQAVRLVDLVYSGLISGPGALVAIRDRLFELVRRPEFEDELAKLKGTLGSAPIDISRLHAVIGRLRQVSSVNEPDANEPDAAGLNQPVTVSQVERLDPARTVVQSIPPPAAGRTILPASVNVSLSLLVDDGRCLNCFALKSGTGVCGECGYLAGVTPHSYAHLPPGTRLMRRYSCGKLLGQGGFGATYIGWDDRLQVKVAVKEYFPVHLAARLPGGTGLAPYTDEHIAEFTVGIYKFLEEA
ncbi:MAG: hypothetical protein WCK65_05270, partial [Rhodospirillaceae bacterium]